MIKSKTKIPKNYCATCLKEIPIYRTFCSRECSNTGIVSKTKRRI